VDRYGIGQVVDMALDHLKNRPLHMSYDIDAVDPHWAPSTGTVVRGGLTFREANYIAEAVSDTGRLVSMDLVEVNTSLADKDAGDKTVEMSMTIVESALGSRIL
jgi:arginase